MAVIFIEGFEKHGPIQSSNANLYQGNGTIPLAGQSLLLDWQSISSGANGAYVSLCTGRAGPGSTGLIFFAIAAGFGNLIRVLSTNYTRLISGFAMNSNLGGQCGLSLLDGTTSQVSLWLDSVGHINVSRNGFGGTILWTSSIVVSANTWHYFEIDATCNNTTGAFQVWMDGASLVTLTGQNTRQSGSNQFNQLWLSTGSNCQVIYDDVYLFDSTGTANNAARGDSVVQTLLPIADTAQKNFMPAAYAIGWYATQTNTTDTPGGPFIFWVPVIPEVNCTINSIGVVPNTATSGNFKGVIYADSGNNPGALLSDGTQVTSSSVGAPLTLPLVTPQALTAGTQYWIGYYTDTTINMIVAENLMNLGQCKGNTYGSGAPAGPITGQSGGRRTWQIWGNCTGTASNFALVDKPPGALIGFPTAQTVDYIASSNAGDEDLYTLKDLTGTVASIACVQVSALLSKDSGGARTMDLRVKSGSADAAGTQSNFAISTSPVQYSTVFETDPNTSAAWTGTAVNNMTAGVKVNT